MKSVILLTLLCVTSLFAELKVGDTFPPLVLVDQFDKKVEVPSEGKLLLSFEKDISTAIQEFLLKQDKNYLSGNHLLYISDVSSLPSFLVNLFVLPTLKEFAFSVALIYDENEMPHEEGNVTVISLEKGVVVKVEFMGVEEFGNGLSKEQN